MDRCIYNDQTGRIAGGADTSFCVARSTRNAAHRTIIAGAKWNGFDNFTGNSLSHLLTPNDNYCSKIVRPNQGKSGPAGAGDEIRIELWLMIFVKERFYGTMGKFIVEGYRIYAVKYFAQVR